MRLPTALFLLAYSLGTLARHRLDHDSHIYYVLQHDPLGDASLDECALHLGLDVVGQVGELEHHWITRTTRLSLDTRSGEDRVYTTFRELHRRIIHDRNSSHVARRVVSSVKMLQRQELRQRIKRDMSLVHRQQGDTSSPSRAVAQRLGIVDPIFPEQWHIINDQYPQHSMNVTGLWEQGITGKGIISAMVDDGLDYESDDLAANFVSDNLFR